MPQPPRPTDFTSPRLFVAAPLASGQAVPLDRPQSNYLGNVLRLDAGATIRVFNGRDGEWMATLAGRKRLDALEIGVQMRPQDRLADVTYAFAPLKHARLDYMAQKATEMGTSRLQPVRTRHTQVSRLNTERMRANVIEAAEQCGILSIAEVAESLPLERWISSRHPDRLLVFCDEAAGMNDPTATLAAQRGATGIDVVIGPEGGFAAEERALLSRQPRVAIFAHDAPRDSSDPPMARRRLASARIHSL